MPYASSIPGSVSLVVAVTGHCDLRLEDEAGLIARTGAILEQIAKKYENTPVLVLSNLAEGAGRIAIRAAIGQQLPYAAVLPCPPGAYRSEFRSTESEAEFEQQWDGARRKIILADRPRPDSAEQISHFLVSSSQALIAIWNGSPTSGNDQTSQTVAMKLGETKLHSAAGPVYHVFAMRTHDGSAAPPSVEIDVRYPARSSEADYHEIHRLLDHYNKDVKTHKDAFAVAAKKSRDGLLGDVKPVGLTPAMDWVAEVYSWSDALAQHYATRSLWAWRIVFLLLGIGGVALTWMHTLHGGWPTMALYYGCLAAAWLAGHWEVRTRQRYRHEDYRALAEALRVQFFWMASGIPDLAAEKYLRKHIGEMVWIRDAMSECGLFDDAPQVRGMAVDGMAARLGLIRKWVRGQKEYFENKSLQYEGKRKVCNRLAKSAAAIGLIAPLAVWLIPGFQKSPHKEEMESISHATAGIAMWWAALVWNYSERRGFQQEASQYARMFDLFREASDELEKSGGSGDFAEVEAIIRKLGHEALMENGDWLAMHRERKLTVGLAAG